MNSVTTKVRNAFKPRRASDESVALGQEKAEGGVVKNLVGASVQATGAAVAEQRTRMQERKSEREQRASEKQAAAEQTADVAASMNEAVTATAQSDASQVVDRYFTYAPKDVSGPAHAAGSADVSTAAHAAEATLAADAEPAGRHAASATETQAASESAPRS